MKIKRILIEITEELLGEIDAYQRAKSDQLGFLVSRQKIVILLLKKGLEVDYGK